MIKKFFALLGVDYDVGNTIFLRLWSIFIGVIVVAIVPVMLSVEEQGYYFTFSSVIGIQVFFELGLNFVVVQVISHEKAAISIVDGQLLGKESAIDKINAIIVFLFKWYRLLAVLFFVFSFVLGWLFFSRYGRLTYEQWLMPWFLLTLFSSINLFISPFFSVWEGMGFVGDVAKLKLSQSVLGYLLMIAFLIFGFGLFSFPAVSAVSSFMSVRWLYAVYKNSFLQWRSGIASSFFSWRSEIFPLQWRIALSWISGYFIFQLFNPLIFMNQGEVEAGRIGLSMSVFSMLLSLSLSWLTAKQPAMATLAAQNNKSGLNFLFLNVVKRAGLVMFSLVFLFVIFASFLLKYELLLGMRFSDMDILVLLAISTIANFIIFSLASYMRAYKKEPMLLNSIVSALLIGGAVLYFSRFSTFAAILAYMSICVCISLPWTVVLFIKQFRRSC